MINSINGLNMTKLTLNYRIFDHIYLSTHIGESNKIIYVYKNKLQQEITK